MSSKKSMTKQKLFDTIKQSIQSYEQSIHHFQEFQAEKGEDCAELIANRQGRVDALKKLLSQIKQYDKKDCQTNENGL